MKNRVSTNLNFTSAKDFIYVANSDTQSIFDDVFRISNSESRFIALVGSYGTGKSSFLLAFRETVTQSNTFFKFSGAKAKCISIVGIEDSIEAELYNVISELGYSDLFTGLKALSSNEKVFILIDEFGYYVEGLISRSELNGTLHFQNFIERFNEELPNVTIITTLHKGLYDYSVKANDLLEWNKVSGRIRVLSFSQGLIAVMSTIKGVLNDSVVRLSPADELLINRLYGIEKQREFASARLSSIDLFTFDIIYHYFKRSAQNERSIFAFVNDEGRIMSERTSASGLFDPVLFFDYLVETNLAELMSSANSTRGNWEFVLRLIDKISVQLDHHALSAVRLIKAIHLYAFYFSKRETLALDEIFLILKGYGFSDIDGTWNFLVDQNCLRFSGLSKRFIFVESSEVLIDSELSRLREEHVGQTKFTDVLEEVVVSQPIFLRKSYVLTGTPRSLFVRFNLNEKDLEINSEVYLGHVVLNIVIDSSKFVRGAGKFLLYNMKMDNFKSLELILLDYLVYKRLGETYPSDKTLRRIVNDELSIIGSKIRVEFWDKLFINNVYSDSQDSFERFENLNEFNSWLSIEINRTYSEVEVNNELINRDKLSTPINSARKELFKRLLLVVNGESDFDILKPLGFPPEKFIFISTLEKWGFRNVYDGKDVLTNGPKVWKRWNTELENHDSVDFNWFFDVAMSRPFGVRKGLLLFIVGYYLILRSKDLAFRHKISGKFFPYLKMELLETLLSRPNEFTVENYDIVLGGDDVLQTLFEGGLIEDLKIGKSALYDFYSKLYVWATELPDSLNRDSDFLSEIDKSFLGEIFDANSPKDLIDLRLPKVLGIEINEDPKLFVERILEAKKRIEGSCDFILKDLAALICEVFTLSQASYRSELKDYLSPVKPDNLGEFSVLFFRLSSEIPDESLYLKSIFESLFNIRFGIHKLDDVADWSGVRSRLELLRELLDLRRSTDFQAKVVYLKKDSESLVLTIPRGLKSTREEYLSIRSELLKLSVEDRVSLLFDIIE